VVLAAVLFVGVFYALKYSGVAASRTPECGLEEHIHTEACYDEALELSCGQDEHTHTDDCYTQPEGETQTAEFQDTTEQDSSQEKSQPEESADASSSSKTQKKNSQSSEKKQSKASSQTAAAAEEAEDDELPDGLKLSEGEGAGYIIAAEMLYLKDNKWVALEEDIPINSPLRISVTYENVPPDTLLENGNQMVLRMPDVLVGDEVSSDITGSDGKKIGVITVTEGYALLTFDQSWLEKQKENGTYVSGNFFIYALANWSQAADPGVTDIDIGNIHIEVDFEDDLAAKYGDVSIEKTVESKMGIDEEGAYLEYTLTVEVPESLPVDKMPEISVKDTFTANTQYIQEYIGITEKDVSTKNHPDVTETYPKGADAGTVRVDDKDPGTLVWTIGDMEKGETRTLTYKVRLTDDYTGGQSKGTLTNEAVVYSKEYPRDEDEANYTPKAQIELSKQAGTYNAATSTITYTVTLKANKDNSYPLENVILKDAMKTSYPQYLTYQEDSVQIDGKALTNADDLSVNSDEASFALNVGTIAAGETKTVTYSVEVARELMATTSETLILNNTAEAYPGTGTTPSGTRYASGSSAATIGQKVWSRKMVMDPLPETTTIKMTQGTVYSAPYQKDEGTTSFDVPEGSYQYSVIVNEAGDWEMSRATFEDTLSSTYLSFVGYVMVEAFDVEEGNITPDMEDEEVSRLLTTPARVAWLKIGSEDSGTVHFSFSPVELGFDTNKKQAYRLTYYAEPYGDLSNISQTSVTNTFTVSGTVSYGPGDGTGNSGTIEIPSISASASTVVQGGIDFTAYKYGWYYTTDTVWPRGELRWVIKVDGTIKRGAQVIDTITSNGTNTNQNHNIWQDSCLGVYRGSLTGKTLANGEEITDVTQCPDKDYFDSLGFTQLTKGVEYQTSQNSTTKMTITFNQDINLGVDESIYIIMRTEPKKALAVTSAEVYQNNLSIKSPGGTEVAQNTASLAGYGHDMIYKMMMGYYTYNADTKTWVTDSTSYHRGRDYTDSSLLTESGTYVDWSVRVDWYASLSGKHELLEQIPDGLEVAYVRIFGLASYYLQNFPSQMLTTPTIDSLENNSNWEKQTVTSSVFSMIGTTTYRSGKTATCTYYYNRSTNQLRMDLDSLYQMDDHTKPDDFWSKGNVEIQILCRVTDPDLLLAGTDTERTVDSTNSASTTSSQTTTKTYTNTVTLNDPVGKTETATADVTLSKSTIDKTMTQYGNNNLFYFAIEANQLGEDLLENKDTLTLIDEMEEPLILDSSTIKVYVGDKNSTTELPADQWSYTLEKKGTTQYIKLTVPDETAFTVRYSASLSSAPYKTVTISNKAYWEGYSGSGSHYTGEAGYRNIGGTASGTTLTTLQLSKQDSSGGTMLAGAVFELQAGTVTNGVFTPDDSDPITLTTEDETGTLGTVTSPELQKDVVYRLTEVEAPAGYVLDSTPHYFLIAKNTGTNDNPQFADYNYPSWVTISYNNVYSYTTYNSRPKIQFTKVFLNKEGKTCTPIPGTYRFGLYNMPKPTATSKPIQVIEVTYRTGEPNPFESLAFENLEEGNYSIFEIDDDGKPITGSNVAATVGGNYFYVTSSGNLNIHITNQNASGGEITNLLNQFSLPDTGGTGREQCFALSVLLMVSAELGYIALRKRKGGRKT
jgi:hypothetical protein